MCKTKSNSNKPVHAIAISPQHISQHKASLAIKSIQNIIEQKCVMEIDVDNFLGITHNKLLYDYVEISADSHQELCQYYEEQINLPNGEVSTSAIVQVVCHSSYLLVQVKQLVEYISKAINSKDIIFNL